MTRRPTPKQLAATYNPSGYDTAWAAVEAYSDWRIWQANHPDAGRIKAATALDMPAGRIRVWQDGGKPDVVRGLDTARELGWLEADAYSDIFRGLNQLIAWLLAAGSIPDDDDSWVPRWSLDHPSYEPLFKDIAADANVDYQISDRSQQGREATPTQHANLLGRILVALGAPRGVRRGHATTLPSYLDESTALLRRQFLRTYLLHAGSLDSDEEVLSLTSWAAASQGDAFAALVTDVVGNGHTITASDTGIKLPFAVVEDLVPERLDHRIEP